jgi:peptide/nickel transport system permease protein
MLQTVVALFFISVILFGLRQSMGDPIRILLPITATQEEVEATRRYYGLDKPLYQQYAIWLFRAVQGDLGKSIMTKHSVTDLFFERLPASILLAGASMIFSLLAGVIMGVVAAVQRHTPLEKLIMVLAMLGQTIPSFWVAILLIDFLSVRFRIFPIGGAGTPLHVILPAVSLSSFSIAAMTRLQRASMLEILDSEYIKLARAKGVSEWLVIFKHGLRNALIPVVTFGGMFFALHIGNAVIIEKVFAWPGVGRLALDAALSRDFPLLQGCVLMFVLIIMFANLVVDLLYGFLDPRIRLEKN